MEDRVREGVDLGRPVESLRQVREGEEFRVGGLEGLSSMRAICRASMPPPSPDVRTGKGQVIASETGDGEEPVEAVPLLVGGERGGGDAGDAGGEVEEGGAAPFGEGRNSLGDDVVAFLTDPMTRCAAMFDDGGIPAERLGDARWRASSSSKMSPP